MRSSTVSAHRRRDAQMQTGKHISELGQWQTVQRAADPRLRAYVHGYFASSSILRMPVQERHLPSAEVPLLLNFGEPHRHTDASGCGEWTKRGGAWVVGLHTRHQLTQAVGERHFMVFRWELFDVLNHRNFTVIPANTVSNATNLTTFLNLGQTSTSVVGRTMQFLVRYSF